VETVNNILKGEKLITSIFEFSEEISTSWDDSKVVHKVVAGEVVTLDLIHVDGFSDAWGVVDVLAVSHNIWIVLDSLSVTLEVDDVDFVKSDQGLESSDVSEGH
jgi:hypothetical protein